MLMNIALFSLGLAIGLLVCSIYTRWQDKQFMDLMASNHDFLERYAKLTDQQYDNLNRYVEDQLTLLNETLHKLLGFSDRFNKDSADSFNKLLVLVKNDHEVKNALMEDLTDFVKEHEKVNEERWSLITDYITNDGPERAEENHNNEDICDWCKNQRTEKCDYCTEPVSSTETYFVNYEAKEEEDDA